jgi:hypothetical protein
MQVYGYSYEIEAILGDAAGDVELNLERVLDAKSVSFARVLVLAPRRLRPFSPQSMIEDVRHTMLCQPLGSLRIAPARSEITALL